jgi:hypothetical protein
VTIRSVIVRLLSRKNLISRARSLSLVAGCKLTAATLVHARASGRYPDGPPLVSARERAILFGPMAETEIVAVPDPSPTQPTAGSRASRSEHDAPDPRLARSRRPRRAAKSP